MYRKDSVGLPRWAKGKTKMNASNEWFSLSFTCFDLHNDETSKQRMSVERIIESFDGSPDRGKEDEVISSIAKFAKVIGTLK